MFLLWDQYNTKYLNGPEAKLNLFLTILHLEICYIVVYVIKVSFHTKDKDQMSHIHN